MPSVLGISCLHSSGFLGNSIFKWEGHDAEADSVRQME